MFNSQTFWSPIRSFNLIYHHMSYILFIKSLIFESQCVELIHLRTISLMDVSQPGIVYRVFLSNHNLSHRSYISLDLLIYLHLKNIFLELEFSLFHYDNLIVVMVHIGGFIVIPCD